MKQVFEIGQIVRTTQRFTGGSSLPAGTLGVVQEVFQGKVRVFFAQANQLVLLDDAAVEPNS